MPGIELDPALNARSEPVITVDGSRATVRVVPTDEELVVAHHTAQLIFAAGGEQSGNEGSRPDGSADGENLGSRSSGS